jgi:hypothetical protein
MDIASPKSIRNGEIAHARQIRRAWNVHPIALSV